MLGPRRQAQLQLLCELVFQAEIHPGNIPRVGSGIVRGQTGSLYATHLHTVDSAKRIRVGITRLQAITLVAVGDPGRDVQRVGQPVHGQVFDVVQTHVGLFVDQRRNLEFGRAGDAKTGVEGVVGQFVMFVAAIGGA